jgi:hypothetical protein
MKMKLSLVLLAAVAVSGWFLPATTVGVRAGVDGCSCFVDVASGDYCWVVCPQGDGPPLSNLAPTPGDATLLVTVKDLSGAPVTGIPAADFWVIGCHDELSLCGGYLAINATGPTDANGQTTIAGAGALGGCDACLHAIVQGYVIDNGSLFEPAELPIRTISPDGDGDLDVDSVDFTRFGNGWVTLGGTYDPCMDFNCDGTAGIIDFTVFGNHMDHACF